MCPPTYGIGLSMGSNPRQYARLAMSGLKTTFRMCGHRLERREMTKTIIVTVKGIDAAMWTEARVEALRLGITLGKYVSLVLKEKLDSTSK